MTTFTTISPTGVPMENGDALYKSFKTEYDQRLSELTKTTLAFENVSKLFDEGAALVSQEDWLASPAVKVCDPKNAVQYLKSYAKNRALSVSMRLP